MVATTTKTTTSADAIIKALRDQANAILSAALGSSPLQEFNVSALGNMKYYWKNPSNLKFNQKTYNWISANLKANTTPIQLDAPFTNEYIMALGKISYGLSTADQAKLNQAKSDATNQQAAVLQAWLDAYGSIPKATATQQPIDIISSTIAQSWAVPPTTLYDIQQSIDLNRTLNNTPASGKTIVPVFANYLNALGASVSLENNSTMNNAYLGKALAATQAATIANGGLETDANLIEPDYAVANSWSSIVNSMKHTAQAVTVSMTVTRSTASEYQLSISGGASFGIPILDFLTVNVGGSASYFQDSIATTDNKTTVKMTFPGVNLVNFGPVPFELATQKNWYWITPITDAIANGSRDVSGFKFAPDPQIDWSKSGPFGFLTGAAISNYPSMVITVESSSYRSIQTTFQQSTSVGLSFLGIPLGISGSESSYSSNTQIDTSKSSVSITINPPQELVAGSNVDSVGWVLGVQPSYPAS